jgi:hypothetical protein
MNWHCDAGCTLLNTSQNTASFQPQGVFNANCTIYQSTCNRPVVFWAMYSPQFTMELENNPSCEMLGPVWQQLIWSICILNGAVNATSYTAIWPNIGKCLFHSSAQTSLLKQQCAATLPSIMPHPELSGVVGQGISGGLDNCMLDVDEPWPVWQPETHSISHTVKTKCLVAPSFWSHTSSMIPLSLSCGINHTSTVSAREAQWTDLTKKWVSSNEFMSYQPTISHVMGYIPNWTWNADYP